MEAIILTLNVACMTYLCWKLRKVEEASAELPDLGFLSYRESSEK